jgi:uncharacterized RDD family membrane protein YckC
MSEEDKVAGLLLRTVAKFLDFIIIFAAIENDFVPKAGFFAGLTYLLISDGFFHGRSLGKKLLGLRVVSSDTQTPCTFRSSILRNSTFAFGLLFIKIPWFGWIALAMIAALEFIMLLGSSKGMRIGDEFAKTIVVENSLAEQEA